MPKKKKRSYRPIALKAREAGKERCDKVGKLTLCVVASKYGYSARLYPPAGSRAPVPWLPVSVGRARSMKSAMSAAKQFVRRAKQKSRR